MTDAIILLDASYALLGEVMLDSGALANVMLTATGETAIGAAVREWQTRGVPVRRELFGTKAHPNDVVFFQERAQPRDRKFGEALAEWAEDRRLIAVWLSAPAMDCWNKVLRLTFEPPERVAVLMACPKPIPQLSPGTIFDEAIRACEVETSRPKLRSGSCGKSGRGIGEEICEKKVGG